MVSVPEEWINHVKGWGPADYNTNVSLEAEAPIGYEFSHWEEDSVILPNGFSNPYTITLEGDRTLYPVFTPEKRDITINPSLGGNFVAYNKNGSEVTEFYQDENYTIILSPDPYYYFSGWNADSLPEGMIISDPEIPLKFLLIAKEDASLDAIFTQKQNYLSVIGGVGADTVFPPTNMYYADTSVQISATAEEGFEFDYWHDPQGIVTNTSLENSEANISKINVSAEITAMFKIIEYNSSTVNLSASGGGNFVLSSNENGKFSHFSEYSLRAIPDSGYEFSHWSGDKNQTNLVYSSNSADNALIVDGEINLQAVFVPSVYSLNTDSNPQNGGEVVGGGGFTLLDNLSVSAYPNPFWEFSGWSGDTAFLLSPDSPTSIVQFTNDSDIGDLNLTALFSKQTYRFASYTEDHGKVVYSVKNADYSHHSNSKNYQVSGGQGSPPYFTFTNQFGETPDFEVLTLHRGATYVFSASGVSESHPFMIGEHYGDLESSLVTGAPLTGSEGNLSVSIPSNFEGSLYYFCLNHNTMAIQFIISDPPTSTSSSDSLSNVVDIPYEAENQITIEGIPDTGWAFKKWTGLPYEEGYSISPSFFDPYIEFSHFEAYEDLEITAQFERNSYEIHIEEVDYGGSSLGQGAYLYEEIVNISAIPSPHYEFVEWSGEDQHLLEFDKTVASNSLKVPAHNVSLSPLFRPKTYHLTLTSGDNGKLEAKSIWNDQNYSDSFVNGTSMVIIDATPNNGFILASLEWNNSSSQQGTSYSSQFIIPSMDANYSFFATFKEPPNDLNYSLTNNSPLQGIIEDHSVKATLNQRTFIATPLPNHSFLGWTFSESANPLPHWTSHEIDVNISEDLEVFAHFAETPTSTLIEHDETKGSVSKQLFDNLHNKRIELSAGALENYLFSEWEILQGFDYNVTTNFSSINESHSKLFINGMESPEIKLVRGHTYTFTCDFENNQNLYFAYDKQDNYPERVLEGITDTQSLDRKFTFTVPLDFPDTIYYNHTSFPFAGNKIKIVDLVDTDLIPYPSNPTINLPQDVDLTIQAHFLPVELELDVLTIGEGQVVLSQNENYRYGDSFEINASPSNHWNFSHWESNIEILNPDFPYIDIILNEDTELTAVFEPQKYSLQISSSPKSFGNAFSENNKYEFLYGETVNVHAIPKNGKRFTNWSGAAVQNDSSSETSITITGNTSLTAYFNAIEYLANYDFVVLDDKDQILEEEVPGKIIGSSTALDDEIVTLSYELEDGYEFMYWRDGDSNLSLSSAPVLSRKIRGNTRTEAVVRKLSYQIRVTSYPQNTGSVLWQNSLIENFFEFSVEHGDAINLSTEPKEGYQFKNWMSSKGNLPFPENDSINFSADSDLQIAAYFEPASNIVLQINIEPNDAGWSVGSGSFNLNEKQPVLAIPKEGWLFKQWIGNDINNTKLASTTIHLRKDSTIIAQFVKDPDFTPPDNDDGFLDTALNVLIVSTEKAEQGTTSGSGFYEDIWVNISATPSSNYIFSHWEGEGVEDSLLSNTRVFVDKDLEIKAHFEFLSNRDHILFVNSNNEQFGEVFGGGNFRDSWANLKAVPNEGYTFVGWEGAGIVDPFSLETQIFVNTTKEAIAYFQRESVFEDSTGLGKEWWENPWFGLYWKSSSSHWTYHSLLGWTHIKNHSDDSMWIWIDRLDGWFWTGKTYFPYLYSANPENVCWFWLSLEKSNPSKLLLYKFGESAGWQSFE